MSNSILPPSTFLTYSLGCRTNQAEIEKISSQLTAYGFVPCQNLCVSESLHLCFSPSLIILNTCVVTQKAEKETRQKIRELRKKYPKSFLIVLGCGVTAKEKFNIDLPEANLLIPNKNKNQTLKLILKHINHLVKTPSQDKLACYSKRVCLNLNLSKYQPSGRKFIKIQEGCNCGCSFCLTQFIRGKPTSVPPEKIIKEINFWVERGIKEIILTGINIGLWGKDLKKQETVNSLIKKILLETKVERLSFSSIYPEMLLFDRSDLLIGRTCLSSLVVNNPRITQCFHLSLQSGSPTVLERMNRKTNLDELLKKLWWIKQNNPYFTFRSDIIVGFPDETEKEFQETLDFIKKTKISFVHHFLFSMRPHTKSEVMIENKVWKEVPNDVKKQRLEILKKEVEKIRKEEARKMVGLSTHCLIIKNSVIAGSLSPKQSRAQLGLLRFTRNDRESYVGITENGWPILVQSANFKAQSCKGIILPIKITGFKKDYLTGQIVSLPIN